MLAASRRAVLGVQCAPASALPTVEPNDATEAVSALVRLSTVKDLRRRVVALEVEWRLVTHWRGQGEIGTRVPEHALRRRELFESEAGLVAGVAELVVGGEDHQGVHERSLA
jgi:hypothetical protein